MKIIGKIGIVLLMALIGVNVNFAQTPDLIENFYSVEQQLDLSPSKIFQIGFIENESRFITTFDREHKTWSYIYGHEKKEALFCGGAAEYATTSYPRDNGIFAFSCPDRTIEVWNLITTQLISRFAVIPPKGISKDASGVLPFSNKDGSRVVVKYTPLQTIAELWDTRNGEKIKTLTYGTLNPPDVWFSNGFTKDGDIVYVSFYKTMVLFDAKTGDRLRYLSDSNIKMEDDSVPVHTSARISFSMLSDDGTTIYTGSRDGMVKSWNISNGELTGTFEKFRYNEVDSIAVSERQGILAASGGRTIKLFDLKSKKLLHSFKERALIISVQFDAKGRLFAISDKDISLWDVESGKLLARTANTFRVSGLAISRSGNKILMANRKSGKVMIYKADK